MSKRSRSWQLVVELGFQPVQPDSLVRAAQAHGGGLDQVQVVVAVGGAGVVQLGTGPLGEVFGGVVPDRFQQPVTGRTLVLVGVDQALADQGSQMVQHLPVFRAVSRGDRFGGLQGPAAREH